MIHTNNLGALMGAPVQGPDDEKIGNLAQLFVDPVDGHPSWMTIHTGLFGRRESFVPLGEAEWDHEIVHIPYSKNIIKDAPRVDTDQALNPDDEDELYRYYHRALHGAPDDENKGDQGAKHDDVHDDAGVDGVKPTGAYAAQPPDANVEDTARTASGRAPVRKYVVTDEGSVTVPEGGDDLRMMEPDSGHSATEQPADVLPVVAPTAPDPNAANATNTDAGADTGDQNSDQRPSGPRHRQE